MRCDIVIYLDWLMFLLLAVKQRLHHPLRGRLRLNSRATPRAISRLGIQARGCGRQRSQETISILADLGIGTLRSNPVAIAPGYVPCSGVMVLSGNA